MLRKETRHKIYILYDSIYVPLWKRQNYNDRKHISGFQGLETERGLTKRIFERNLGTVMEIFYYLNCDSGDVTV